MNRAIKFFLWAVEQWPPSGLPLQWPPSGLPVASTVASQWPPQWPPIFLMVFNIFHGKEEVTYVLLSLTYNRKCANSLQKMGGHWGGHWEATEEATGRPLGGHCYHAIQGLAVISEHRFPLLSCYTGCVLAVIFEHRFPSFRVGFLSEKSAATRRSFGDQRSTKKT